LTNYDKDNEDVALVAPILCTEDVEPSVSVTDGWKELKSRDDNILLFSVIWAEAHESTTHV